MRRIRTGNEFTQPWVIERLGELENLNVATDVVLLLKTQDGTEFTSTSDVAIGLRIDYINNN